MTVNGIEWNLEKSPYKVTIGKTTYVFSSELYVKKFNERLKENRDILNYSLKRRFGINCNFNDLADLLLYSKIEKRGFLVIIGGESIKCLNSTKLSGVVKTTTC